MKTKEIRLSQKLLNKEIRIDTEMYRERGRKIRWEIREVWK